MTSKCGNHTCPIGEYTNQIAPWSSTAYPAGGDRQSHLSYEMRKRERQGEEILYTPPFLNVSSIKKLDRGQLRLSLFSPSLTLDFDMETANMCRCFFSGVGL